MVFKKDGYTLYRHKKKKHLMFFAQKSTKGTPIDLPKGYVVKVNKKTGLPYLKKK
jgi:hypothetical protein